ncbi:unnamed protein product [Rhodiola kirilowii]
MKTPTIDSFFKRKITEISEKESHVQSEEHHAPKVRRLEIDDDFDINKLERDPGLRPQIWKYPISKRDEVRRAYINFGPYQPILDEYPKSVERNSRSFQSSWYTLYASWLEYSKAVDAVFCLPCFLFQKEDGPSGSNAFTVDGFRTWNKVRGKACSLMAHVGKDHNSPHHKALLSWSDLMNQPAHISNRFGNFRTQEILDNRLRLKTSIEVVRWLAYQSCAFRGNDESDTSRNRGNFIELLRYTASLNSDVAKVLDNAPRNATYTSPNVQKQILHVLAIKVKKCIREEIGCAKFCIIVDEARDESKKEQMSLVLRFVDKDGCIQERFFGLLHVKDTASLTLKDGILSMLSQYNLDIMSIRGQGYDGASNMRGEWNGLQALVSRECPYAYYVHCFAHRLQLSLVAASKEVYHVHHFFEKLNFIVNIVSASCKRNDQLKDAHASNMAFLLAIGDLESGSGLNQLGSLQRAGETRWTSHFKSISSLIKMFSATCEVLLTIKSDGNTHSQRGEASSVYETMTSFYFVFIMHLMREVLDITSCLCNALQLQSQDILNAMSLVSTSKSLLQKLRDDGWSRLVEKVRTFCGKVNIEVPDFSAPHETRRGASHQQNRITIEHYYKVDIFYTVIDSQLQELNNRFNDDTVELIILSSALDPKELRTTLRVDDICKLVEKFYPIDFDEDERTSLRMELQHFDLVQKLPDFNTLTEISELCQWLTRTRKSNMFPLIYKVITLILTLPVSTATTERSFSRMNIVKNALRNKMEDDFLSDCLVINIEKEIAQIFSTDSIIDDFRDMETRRSLF